ncbi:MAG: (d)CMP kinase [Flavobacteriales bacterium AspAUS03]
MKNKIIITIDGYSSTGKSTLAQALARKLDYKYIDSGAMYRAVTLFALRRHIFNKDPWDQKRLRDLLPEIKLCFQTDQGISVQHLLLNGEKIETEIRSMAVSEKVSLVASIPEVREKLLHLQQALGQDRGIVMDGRDIGSVVFPNATLKIFLTASLEVRASRRYKELIEKGQKTTYEKVLNNLTERDRIDSSRRVAPLIKPIDAIEIDNTHLSLEAQLIILPACIEQDPKTFQITHDEKKKTII